MLYIFIYIYIYECACATPPLPAANQSTFIQITHTQTHTKQGEERVSQAIPLDQNYMTKQMSGGGDRAGQLRG